MKARVLGWAAKIGKRPSSRTLSLAFLVLLLGVDLGGVVLEAWWHQVFLVGAWIAATGINSAVLYRQGHAAGRREILAVWHGSLDANKGEMNQEAEIIMAAARARDDWVRRHVGGSN